MDRSNPGCKDTQHRLQRKLTYCSCHSRARVLLTQSQARIHSRKSNLDHAVVESRLSRGGGVDMFHTPRIHSRICTGYSQFCKPLIKKNGLTDIQNRVRCFRRQTHALGPLWRLHRRNELPVQCCCGRINVIHTPWVDSRVCDNCSERSNGKFEVKNIQISKSGYGDAEVRSTF